MIEVRHLTKRYGAKLAVDDLSFQVRPGNVTGFLGPNGAGKSTTMRLLLGLDRPDAGSGLVKGKPYKDLGCPLRTVGALLEGKPAHQGRSACDHLWWVAQTQGLPRRRVEEVLGAVGLADVGTRRAGTFSLGMGQRLGIATALLGDPEVLVLDEPVNGLDAAGVAWARQLMQRLASEGRTVLVSSHLLSEMAATADHLVVIRHGRLVADCSLAELIGRTAKDEVLVVSPDAGRLAGSLEAAGATIVNQTDQRLTVSGLVPSRIAEVASATRAKVDALTPQVPSLEEAYLALTGEEPAPTYPIRAIGAERGSHDDV